MKIKRMLKQGLAVLGIMTLLSLPSEAGYKKIKQNDIIDTAVKAGTFKTLVAALTEAGLVDALKDKGPFTVFAPTDEAFLKLPKGTVESLLKPENRDKLTAILTYHVISGKVRAKDVMTRSGTITLNGQRLGINIKNDRVYVDKSQVVKTDIKASNGIIHIIDTVLLPESETIVGVAKNAGTFETLIAAAKAAGFVDALSAEGPITVFAPTDDAFSQLPNGTVESLLKKENLDKLRTILKYHLVPGRIFSDDVLEKQSLMTLAEEKLIVSAKKTNVRVNESSLLAVDINASNGVIHVIDRVLLPQSKYSSRMTSTDLIELAIRHGVPLYNEGNPHACAAIYEVAARALIEFDEDLTDEAHMALHNALMKMQSTNNRDERAWILRRGLDSAHQIMMSELSETD